MLYALVLSLLVVMVLAFIRACLGPTIYDRILAVNVFGTKIVLFIAAIGYLFGRPDFLDIAMVYALINFISVIAVLRYFEYGRGAEHGPAAEQDSSASKQEQ